MPNIVRLTEVMGRPELSAVLDYTKQLDNVDEPYLHVKACMEQNALLGASFPDYFQLSTGSKPQVDVETNLVTSGYRKLLSKKMAAEHLQAAKLSSELPSLSAENITRQVMYPEVNDWEVEESATKISEFNKDLNVECFRRVNVSYAVPKYDESLPKAHAFLAAIYLQYSTIEKGRGYTVIKTKDIQCSSYALVSSIFKGYSQVTAEDRGFFVSDVSVKGLGAHVVRANIMLANEGASVPLATWSKVEDWLNVIYHGRYANLTNDAVVKQLPEIVEIEEVGQVRVLAEGKVKFEVHGAKSVSVTDLAKVLEWFAHLLDVPGKQMLNQMKLIKPRCQRDIVADHSNESESSGAKMHRRNAMDKEFTPNRFSSNRSVESIPSEKTETETVMLDSVSLSDSGKVWEAYVSRATLEGDRFDLNKVGNRLGHVLPSSVERRQEEVVVPSRALTSVYGKNSQASLFDIEIPPLTLEKLRGAKKSKSSLQASNNAYAGAVGADGVNNTGMDATKRVWGGLKKGFVNLFNSQAKM